MMMNEVVLMCGLIMAEMISAYGGHIPKHYEDRMSVCAEVGMAAEDSGVPVALALSVAYEESRFQNGLVSEAKAQGPLQIIPAYFCPNKDGLVEPHRRQGRLQGCDLTKYGILALRWFYDEYGTWEEGLCHYNSGTECYSSSRAYSKRVRKRWKKVERQVQTIMMMSGDSGVPKALD